MLIKFTLWRGLRGRHCGEKSGEGGIRVGLEDNIWYNEARTIYATNEMLVKRMVELAEMVERPLASPEDVREILNLKHLV